MVPVVSVESVGDVVVSVVAGTSVVVGATSVEVVVSAEVVVTCSMVRACCAAVSTPLEQAAALTNKAMAPRPANCRREQALIVMAIL